MTKPIIAVDIDDVLTPHFQDLVSWYNAQYGTHLTLSDNHPKSVDGWGTASEEEAIRRVHNFFETDEFMQAEPYKEARTVLQELSKRFELVVVTARDTIIEKVTRNWLDEHFSELFSAVHFTAQYNLEGLSKSKADVIRSIRAQYLIDDAPDHILKAAEAGVVCVLFGDYPWNQEKELPKDFVRCKDWAEVLDYFNGQP